MYDMPTLMAVETLLAKHSLSPAQPGEDHLQPVESLRGSVRPVLGDGQCHLNSLDFPPKHGLHVLRELPHQLQAIHLFDLQTGFCILVLLGRVKMDRSTSVHLCLHLNAPGSFCVLKPYQLPTLNTHDNQSPAVCLHMSSVQASRHRAVFILSGS